MRPATPASCACADCSAARANRRQPSTGSTANRKGTDCDDQVSNNHADANHSGTSTCEQAHLPICGLVPTRTSVCRVRAGLQRGSSILDHCAVSVKLQFASKLCSTIIIRRVCIQYTLNNRMNCKLNGAIMCKNKIIIARLVENSNTLHKVNQCTTQVNACSLHVHNIHDTNQS